MSTLVSLGRRGCIGFVLGVVMSGAMAQDTWQQGRGLFTSNCSTCHYHTVAESGKTNKAGRDFGDIKGALSSVGAMSGITLSDPQITLIASYLSTPRHASLSPSSTAFADTPIGLLPRPQTTFTLTNDGLVSLVATGAATTVDGFAIDASACSATLAVNATCAVTVEFRPVAATDYSTTVTVNHDGFGSSSSSSVSGRGLLNVEITTAALPFTAALNATSAAQTFSIANRLSSNLRLCLVDAATFPAPAEFDLVGRVYETSSRCTTLTAPGASVSQNITFTPTLGGPRFARFTVERVGTADLHFRDLQGNAGPFGAYDNTELFTGVRQDINLGATAPVTLRLTNAGSSALVVDRSIPQVAGASANEYFVSGCANGTSLAPNASCDMSLTFDPAVVGPRQTDLVISYGGRTDRIALRGTGFVGPELIVRNSLGNPVATNSTFDFGRQNVDIVYPERLTLTNIGSDEALIVSTASIAPAASGFAAGFPSVGGCASLASGQAQTLAPGASCTVEVRFAPLQATTYSAALTLQSRPAVSATPPPSQHRLNVTGEGANDIPVLLWRDSAGNDLSTVAFPAPATPVGAASPPRTTIRLANLGPGAAALRLLNVIGTGAANFAIDPAPAGSCTFGAQALPLFQGQTCEVTIVFTPQTAGTKQAGLQLASTGTTPQPLQITAQASGPAAGVAVSVLPATISFDAVRVGAQSSPVTVTLASTGSATATVTGIEADQPFSVQASTCPSAPFPLPPQSSCTMTLSFAPVADGAAAGSLRVLLEGQAALDTPLSGDGVAPADLSSGGCTLTPGATVFDPTLWALGLLAAAALLHRRRMRRRDLRRPAIGDRH
jgi:hypothetical protein